MKAIVLGLGSMGKRRIRCLQSLGISDISGIDIRLDRRQEACEKYGVDTFCLIEDAISKSRPDFVIISLPPSLHVKAMSDCVLRKIPFFVEASVLDDGLDKVIHDTKIHNLIAAPSATLNFHPAIIKINEIVRSGRLGKISNIIYHSGQYLPDWHSYELVSDYYVSNPSTGGAREIVPFELTWLTSIFGFPIRVAAQFRKTIDIPGAELIDDTYNFLLDYEDFLANITVDVVSRVATRRLTINGAGGQLIWSWDDPTIGLFDGNSGVLENIKYQMTPAEPGYNKNISEGMYIEEIRVFLNAVSGGAAFPNTLERDHRILKLLYALESSGMDTRSIEI